MLSLAQLSTTLTIPIIQWTFYASITKWKFLILLQFAQSDTSSCQDFTTLVNLTINIGQPVAVRVPAKADDDNLDDIAVHVSSATKKDVIEKEEEIVTIIGDQSKLWSVFVP